jgi:hypothetical protein
MVQWFNLTYTTETWNTYWLSQWLIINSVPGLLHSLAVGDVAIILEVQAAIINQGRIV